MTKPADARGKYWIRVLSIVSILFGLLTIKEGGGVLFWSEEARDAAGRFVLFVLWFNFLAGFAYVIAGVGLLLRYRWAAGLAILIAVSTLAVFAAFGLHVVTGGGFEPRTVVAMSLRSIIWLAIAAAGYQFIWKSHGMDRP